MKFFLGHTKVCKRVVNMEDICKCDVGDKEKLALFRCHFISCQKILSGKDKHAITNQIQDIVWDDTVYRTYDEARRLSEESNNRKTGLSGTLIELIDNTFIVSQIMAIRRLIDPNEWRIERKVYSLPSIIAEIKINKHLYTRENYVCFDGLSYEKKGLKRLDELENMKRHMNYDYLAETKETDRKRNDQISNNVFEELKRLLAKTELIRSYSNKFIAHAAAPGNRTKTEERLRNLTLKYIEDCYIAIIKAGKILQKLLNRFLPVDLAVPNFDHLENWDKPIVTSADKKKLAIYWDNRWKYFDELNRL